MDRNTVIGTVLITLILMVWMFYLTPPPSPENQTTVDSLATQEQLPLESEVLPDNQEPPLSELAEIDSTIAGAATGEERFIVVENDLYTARFSTLGATLVSYELKEYLKFDQVSRVEIVDSSSMGALSLAFTTPANHNVDTRGFYFESPTTASTVQVAEDGTRIEFTTTLGAGSITKTYLFTPGSYEVGLDIDFQNPSSFMTREGYELIWKGGLPFTEDDAQQEALKAAAYARSGGEVEGVDLTSDSYEEQTLRGDVSWISVKNQYFAAILIPEGTTRGADLVGERFGDPKSPDVWETYEARLMLPQPEAGVSDLYKLYIGPLEFNRIRDYGLNLYDMVDYGWDFFEWMTRPIAKFVFIPVFTLLSKFIPSYGIVIIILAFLIKLLVYPLTKSSYRSMAKMREVQPQLQAIREKYSDNPQKQQEATMKLYKEGGVNPLGGCLPMLFQYPIIIALWQFLPQSIEIRQQGFLWANDLSAPDKILSLPFEIPFYGDFIAGFCLLMGISMVFQMRLQSTAAAGPQAKMMMYFMPIMLFVIFNRFASGLNLYYLCYNILSAIQQRFINKEIEKEKEEADANPAASKKNGRAAKKNGVGKNGQKRSKKTPASRKASRR